MVFRLFLTQLRIRKSELMEVKKKKKRYGDVVFTCDEKPGGWIVNPVLAERKEETYG